MTILIVDDNAQNIYQLQVLLGASGFDVACATNGAEALARARQAPPDLIVSDILMPVMDGFALCRECRKDAVLRAIPFIFYTATYTDQRDRDFALSLGAAGFFVKPDDSGPFLEAVLQLTASQAPQAPAPAAETDTSYPARGETAFLAQYNAALIRKLEDKMAQLEQANRHLKQEIKERERAEEERQRLHAQLLHAQKLESLGTLASGVAHEINNRICCIMNLAQLVLEGLEPSSPLEGHASMIVTETRRAATITKDMLSFARQDKHERAPASLLGVVNSALSLFAAPMRQDQIAVETVAREGLPLVVCNATRIQQVIINLLANARHALNEKYPASHPDKKIIITLRPFDKDGRTWLRATVEDHGVGIPDHALARIFDPFFTTKPRDQGTGLGLSVSHGIIREHDGDIRVETQHGQWTRFHLELPASPA